MYEENLIQQRDEHLQQLNLKYINYINQLLHQKLWILTNIQKQYDEKINTIRHKYDAIKDKQLQTCIAWNNSLLNICSSLRPVTGNSNIKSYKPTKTTNNNNNVNNNSSSSLPALPSPNPNPSANNNKITPFIPHLTMNQAKKLKVNDKIDHRDFIGYFNEAIIIDKKGTNLKIHYLNWSDEWDVWCDSQKELCNLAKYQSISNRNKHNHFHLKKGDFVHIKTLKDNEWKKAEILQFDDKSGQIKTGYKLNDEDDDLKYWWVHADNINEIELILNDSDMSSAYYCIYCLFEFKDYNEVRTHVINKHKERPNICDKCPESFPSQKILNSHKMQHNEYEKWKCNLCIKYFNCKHSFDSEAKLSGHIYQIHKRIPIKTTSKPRSASKTTYYCIYCSDLFFKTYSSLRYHVNVSHVNDRPFICAHCPQAFGQVKHLEGHLKQHIANGYYKCNLCIEYFKCKTSFVNSGSLTTHHDRLHKHNRKRKTNTISKKAKYRRLTLTKSELNKIYVSKHKLWKLWKSKEKQIKVENKEITKRYQINLLLKQGFKQFIITNNLCKEWLSKWDAYTVNHLENEVLLNICMKDKPLRS